jgi:hypothetical protein
VCFVSSFPFPRPAWLFSRLSLVLVTLLMAACGGGGGGSSSPAATQSIASAPSNDSNSAAEVALIPDVADVRISSYALWSDELASTPLVVEVRESGSTAPEVAYFDGFIGGSGARLVHALFDDGSHGDAIAGDGIWTLSFTLDLAEPAALRLYDGMVDVLPLTIQTSGGERTVEVAVVSRVLQGSAITESLNASVMVTDSLISMVDATFDGQTLSDVTENLYTLYADDPFDFLVIFHTRPTGDGVPRSLGVRNAIGGINLNDYDTSAAYGSAGRLQQVIFQNANLTGREVNHELGHRWGAFLDDPALNLSIPTGFHWGVSEHVGQLGNGPFLLADGNGGYLVTNANGSENFISNDYSPLELYLMGLASPAEVAPLRFVTDPSVDVSFGTTLPESSTRLVSIADIVAIYGERVPASTTSPKVFSAAFVVVSDALLSEAEYTLSTHIARYVGGVSTGGVREGGLFELMDPSSFAAATDFRASLETRLPRTG